MKAAADTLAQRRYALVPQMRDYDALEEKVWLPYLMTFQRPDCHTHSFTTDGFGFRRTLLQGEPLTPSAYNAYAQAKGALIGASTAFGVGASSDAWTLASLLTQKGPRVWFNFAGRAFNSTQELMAFLLHCPSQVDTVLIVSGINNLVLSCLSGRTSPIFNSFYAQSVFERGLQRGETAGVWGALKFLAHEVSHRFSSNGVSQGGPPQDHYENIAACMRRDLRLWSFLGKGMGFRVVFVFQPIATWIEKMLTQEEEELFSILDAINPTGSWARVSEHLSSQRERYVRDVEEMCRVLGIRFLDLNRSPSFRDKRWLFVDRAHLTDEGYALAAQEIARELSL